MSSRYEVRSLVAQQASLPCLGLPMTAGRSLASGDTMDIRSVEVALSEVRYSSITRVARSN